MKTFIAKPVVVPSDLAEQYDKRTHEKEGYLRNLFADMGQLHTINANVLAVGLMPMVKTIMEAKDLPDAKPLSLERLSGTMFVLMMAYCTGALHLDSDGDVLLGEEGKSMLGSALHITTLLEHDEIQFANGNKMSVKTFVRVVEGLTSEEKVKPIYGKVITKKGGFKKVLEPSDAFNLARAVILASDNLMEQEF
jgi:hypothetical protein